MKNPISIAALRPTQLTLGLDEVKQRAERIAKMSSTDREAYIEDKCIPYVLGPERRIYMLDHHHLVRALWELKIEDACRGKMKKDWSDLSLPEFWKKMQRRGYCWPIDADGNRRPPSVIPHHIGELADNIWRKLARDVRGKAFKGRDTPYQEFMWGDYFRTFMSRRLLELDFPLARRTAIEVAQLDEARDLPGYIGAGKTKSPAITRP